jgi:hypothetical protein
MTSSFGFGSGDFRGGAHLLRALLQSSDAQFLDTLASVTEPQQLRALQDQFEGICPSVTPQGLAGMIGKGILTGGLSVQPPSFEGRDALPGYAESGPALWSSDAALRAMLDNPLFRLMNDDGGGFRAGGNSPSQGAFGISPGGGGDVSGVLNDASLTVEDKVTLMIMMIMKKMDKDIEQEANHVNSLQQQQDANGQGEAGANGSGSSSSPSIDVETMKLKRLIDKRSQMFDMLRQIIDKYNETAKGIIDSMRQ